MHYKHPSGPAGSPPGPPNPPLSFSLPALSPSAAGLALYGYKLMRALGVKMTKLTNSRGAWGGGEGTCWPPSLAAVLAPGQLALGRMHACCC
jgi:hypothetical protein